MKLDVSLPALDVSSCTFIGVHTILMLLDLTDDAPLGFQFDRCPHLHWAYVSRVLRRGTGTKHRSLKNFKQGFQGAYVVKIDDTPNFSLDDIAKVVTCLGCSCAPPTTVELVLALERNPDHDGCPGPLHLRLADLRCVCALGEGDIHDNAIPARSYANAISTYAPSNIECR